MSNERHQDYVDFLNMFSRKMTMTNGHKNVFRLVLRLFLPDPLKLGVKSRIKI